MKETNKQEVMMADVMEPFIISSRDQQVFDKKVVDTIMKGIKVTVVGYDGWWYAVAYKGRMSKREMKYLLEDNMIFLSRDEMYI
jgi:hypothetical protein